MIEIQGQLVKDDHKLIIDGGACDTKRDIAKRDLNNAEIRLKDAKNDHAKMLKEIDDNLHAKDKR